MLSAIRDAKAGNAAQGQPRRRHRGQRRQDPAGRPRRGQLHVHTLANYFRQTGAGFDRAFAVHRRSSIGSIPISSCSRGRNPKSFDCKATIRRRAPVTCRSSASASACRRSPGPMAASSVTWHFPCTASHRASACWSQAWYSQASARKSPSAATLDLRRPLDPAARFHHHGERGRHDHGYRARQEEPIAAVQFTQDRPDARRRPCLHG